MSALSRLNISAVLTAMTVAALPAQAAEGFYGKLGLGLSYIEDSEVKASNSRERASGTIEYDTGYMVSAAVGYGFKDRYRVEFETALSRNTVETAKVDDYNGRPLTGQYIFTDLNGDVYLAQFGVNAFLDFSAGKRYRPYIGLGGAYVPVSIESLSAKAGTTSVSIQDPETQHLFALNLMAGVGIALNDRLTLGVDYRLGWIPSDLKFTDKASDTKVTVDYRTHSIGASLRMSFGGKDASAAGR